MSQTLQHSYSSVQMIPFNEKSPDVYSGPITAQHIRSVGERDGVELGDWDGKAEGLPVGSVDGQSDGDVDGDWLGEVVGL